MIQNSPFYTGVVEDRNDPLTLGRVKIRVAGLHIHDKNILPTDDLPWAMIVHPVTGGNSVTSVAPVEGTTVMVVFSDYPANQQPIVIGVLSGIPQPQSVYIDRHEDTPLFKDDITPQGRKIPVNAVEATAYQSGPITSPNPYLINVTEQARTQSSATGMGIIQSAFQNTATTMGSVGKLIGAVGGVGSTYGMSKNAIELLLIGSGNKNVALERFKVMAMQSGPLGNALTTMLNGKASLKSLKNNYKLSLSSIESSLKNIDSPEDILGVLTNAEQISYTIGSLAVDSESLLTTIYEEMNNVTLEGTIGGISGDIQDMATSILGEFGSIASSGISQIQSIADVFGLGDLTSMGQSAVNSITSYFSDPVKVESSVGDGTYSTKLPSLNNIGNINAAKADRSTIDGNTYKDVPEGITPPVYGSYGGPNFGGAKPSIRIPQTNMSKYVGGSKGNIPITPPTSFRGDKTKAEASINALLTAAKKHGLTTREQQASLLAIVGGESQWMPVVGNAQYSSPARLNQTFFSTFKGNMTEAERYSNWLKGNKGTTAQFFDYIYDPANNGRLIGNTRPGDGALYYDRGFIQLAGRPNYTYFAKASGYPIDTNPDLLITDINISAEIAVLYFIHRVKNAVPTAHPGYFYAAKNAVGKNSADNAAKKLSYYEYFYGTATPETYGYCDKTAGNTQNPYTYNGAMIGGEAGQTRTNGFQDPHNKYPLKRYVYEPEVNRLARGVIKETIVALKQSKRTIGVPLPFDAGAFDQPHIPYGAKYPYNRVNETESGHVQEWDDTPGYERIHTYHRSGTFEEIDANGTKVTKIVGDNYVLYDRNGFISIMGEANVTVGGNVNIFCRSDANIEVAGSVQLETGGNFDIGVARDMNINVGGNFSLWADGIMNLQTNSKAHILSNDNMYVSTTKEMHVQSTENMHVESKQETHIKSIDKIHINSDSDVNIKSDKNVYINSDAATHIKAGSNVYVNSESEAHIKSGIAYISSDAAMHIKAAGNVEIDGVRTNLNSDTAIEANEANIAVDADESIKAVVNGMIPPQIGMPLYTKYDPLIGPELYGEESFMYELPEDGQTSTSQMYHKETIAQEGISNSYQSETAIGSGGTDVILKSSNYNQIMNTTTFYSDYKLSQHFTLGMLFYGGFNKEHKLVAQNGLSPQQIVANLASLCENILEKYLQVLPNGITGYSKNWMITSGYRMGSSKSDHCKGRAVDIQLMGRDKKQHFDLVQELDKLIPYDQLILEYRGQDSVWIHTGFRGEQNRKMAFTMVNDQVHNKGFALLA